ncbi:hypothetical protein F2P81_008379 [Scophthalmus maximus]|uniref:Uncharacterized protein n=1 Tax=Scophthalmus maximus TaxID=52904 RepID=A0A6A4TAH1_SCOMX|nr:hypothetical protein F2P81_008379 [Scophthalmus maximus]
MLELQKRKKISRQWTVKSQMPPCSCSVDRCARLWYSDDERPDGSGADRSRYMSSLDVRKGSRGAIEFSGGFESGGGKVTGLNVRKFERFSGAPVSVSVKPERYDSDDFLSSSCSSGPEKANKALTEAYCEYPRLGVFTSTSLVECLKNLECFNKTLWNEGGEEEKNEAYGEINDE